VIRQASWKKGIQAEDGMMSRSCSELPGKRSIMSTSGKLKVVKPDRSRVWLKNEVVARWEGPCQPH
jgi:hypothetical protein